MAAGTSTPVEAGQGPSVLNIAMSIGAKIRDAAEDAKEQREKAAEKGETPKKGSLFKSALSNQFNPIKSKKAKSNWAKQFDWNKTSKSDQQVKPPTGGGGGGEGKAKLKEFIAGGFTAILKDTGMMVSKLDGVKMMAGENLSEVTRASSTLTVIKDSIDTQTELRRKALEEAKFSRTEKKLEKTSDSAGVSDTKKPEDKKDGEGGGEDGGGGGPWDWISKALGIADLLDNFLPGLNKLNPFNKPTITQGRGGKPSGPRMPGTGPKITTSGGAPAPKIGSGFNLKNLRPGRGGLLGIGMMGVEMFMPQIQDAMSGFAGALGFGDTKLTDTELIIKILDEQARYKKLAEQNAQLPGGEYLTPSEDEYNFGNLAALKREAARRNLQIPGEKLSEGGIVPSAVPPSPISPMAEGGIAPGLYSNPTQGMLSPGQSVIPLNRSEGKAMFGKSAEASPSETAMDTVGAMILGVSAGMLGKTNSGSVGDQVKQDIRKASKEFGISNLTFTSSIGNAQFGKVDTNKDARSFMQNLFQGMSITSSSGGGSGGQQQQQPPPPPPGGGPETQYNITGGQKITRDMFGSRGFRTRDGLGSGATAFGHTGRDVGMAEGTPLSVVPPGTVVAAKTGDNGGYGNFVVIKLDDGRYIKSNHHKRNLVKEGDRVGMQADGSVKAIAEVGSTGLSTGPHMHLDLGTGFEPPYTITGLMDPDNFILGGGVIQGGNAKASVVGQTATPPVAQQPGGLPQGQVSPVFDWKERGGVLKAQGGLVETIKSWFGLAQDRNMRVSNQTQMGKTVSRMQLNRMLMEGDLEGYERARQSMGMQGGGSMDSRHAHAARLRAQRASAQRSRLGVQKVNGKWVNMGVSDRAVGSNPWWQVWNKKGATAERRAKQEALAKNLAERLNKQEAAKLKPNSRPSAPAPGRAPASGGGTRPAPSSSASSGSSTTAVVMPPSAPTGASASSEGSFGSALPDGKTKAMIFADFLYPDLV